MPDGSAPKPAKISQAKGKPWIHWVGKRGIEEISYFPAQETERFDPTKEIEAGAWSNLLFHGDNKEVMGHLLHKYRGQVDLVYIDPPFDSKADYIRKAQLRGAIGKHILGEEHSLLEQVQYNDLWANDSIFSSCTSALCFYGSSCPKLAVFISIVIGIRAIGYDAL